MHSKLQRAVLDIQQSWDEFYSALEQPAALRRSTTLSQSISDLEGMNPGADSPGGSPTRTRSLRRSISWAIADKSRTKRLIDDIASSNDFVKEMISELFRYLPQLKQGESPALANLLNDSEGPPEEGLPTQLKRLKIQKGKLPPNEDLVKNASYLTELKTATLGPKSSLQAKRAGSSLPVVVEYLPCDNFQRFTLSQALKLATLLSQPNIDGFGVLKCIGVVENRKENRFEYIHDLSEPRLNFREGEILSEIETIAALHSLDSQLPGRERKVDRNGGLCMFGYYKIKEATTIPISINDRLMMARSLAQTVKHLHQADWVHGNITSSNVYFFHEKRIIENDEEKAETETNGDNSSDTKGDGKEGGDDAVVKKVPEIESKPLEADSKGKGKEKAVNDTNKNQNKDKETPLPSIIMKGTYLFGFQLSRSSHENSNSRTKSSLQDFDNWHRHPDRRVLNKNEKLDIRQEAIHDIYSLGVVFLEIGMGQTAEKLALQMNSMRGRFYGKAPNAASAMAVSQAFFVYLAENFLHERMGVRYAAITRLCLSGDLQLLEDSGGNQVTVQMAFLLQVLEPLDELVDTMMRGNIV